MLKNNLLGDRLNAIRNGKPAPEIYESNSNKPIVNNNYVEPNKKVSSHWINKFKILDVFLASFLYGFAIKTLFGLDWSILGAFSVGFLFNHSITIFPKLLFPNFFRKQ